MSEVSSKPEKMWFNGRVWNLGSHSLPKPLQTIALRGQSAKREKCVTFKFSGEKRERSGLGYADASWWAKFFTNQVCFSFFVRTCNTEQLRDQGERWWLVATFLPESWILHRRNAFKHLRIQTHVIFSNHHPPERRRQIDPSGHLKLYSICYYMTVHVDVDGLLWERRVVALLWSDILASHRNEKLPSPVTCCTWTEHERLKTRRGGGTGARGEACLVSTSKSLQLSTSTVSITVKRSWQGQPICYAVCALFRQTHRMCQG